MKLGILGPKGTFTDEAAKELDYDIVYYDSHKAVFDALNNEEVKFALIAIENQLTGTVIENQDALLNSELKIIEEVVLPIHHCLSALKKDSKINKIYSHPQGFLQCKKYLDENYPDARRIITRSTADAFKLIKKDNLIEAAAIGPNIAAETYGLEVLKSNIEDFKTNETRFFLITNTDYKVKDQDKTSIVFKVKHYPGSLVNCLQRLSKNNINLTKIESRPIPENPWEYAFFVDFEGGIDDKKVKLALSEMEAATTFIKLLGSYRKGGKNKDN